MLVTSVALATPAAAATNSWQQLGPNAIGGDLAVAGTTLVAVTPGNAQVWTSVDKGVNWSLTSRAPGAGYEAGFAVLDSNPDHLLVLRNDPTDSGYDGDLEVTRDGGRTWQTLATYPKIGGFQLAADASGTRIVVQTMNGFDVSVDAGRTWSTIVNPWGDSTGYPVNRKKIVLRGDSLYVVAPAPDESLWRIDDVFGSQYAAHSLYRPPTPVWSVAVDGANLAVTQGPSGSQSVFASTNAGASWQEVLTPPEGETYADPVFATGTLYASTGTTLAASTDMGRTWSRYPVPGKDSITSITALPGTGGTSSIFASSPYTGIWSLDSRGRFTGVGLPGVSILGLTFASYRGQQTVVAAGTDDTFQSAVRSAPATPDSRNRWTTDDNNGMLMTKPFVVTSPSDNGTVWRVQYGGYSTTAQVSRDGGATWSASAGHTDGSPLAFTILPASTSRKETLVVAVQTVGGAQVATSSDGGTTWTTHSTPAFRSLAATPSGTTWAGNEDGLWRSDDGGSTFRKVQAFDVTAVHVSGSVVVAGGTRIHVSTNDGKSFRDASLGGGAVTGIAIDPGDPKTMFAGTAGATAGVWKTINSGATWVPAPAGLSDPNVLSLAISPDGTWLYAGTQSSAIYRIRP
jgi:hypothetical protein